MPTKLIVTALLVVAAGGCRMCSDSCDYSPPVAGSPHNGMTSRAGSVFSGAPLAPIELEAPQELPGPPPVPLEAQTSS